MIHATVATQHIAQTVACTKICRKSRSILFSGQNSTRKSNKNMARLRASTIRQRRPPLPLSAAKQLKRQQKQAQAVQTQLRQMRRNNQRAAQRVHEKSSLMRLRNSLDPKFSDPKALPKSNWTCIQVSPTAAPSGIKWQPLNQGWVKKIRKARKDPTIEILHECWKRHEKVKKTGTGTAKTTSKRSLIHKRSIMGWCGSQKLVGSQNHLLASVPPVQQPSWRETTCSTREFAAYLARQRRVGKDFAMTQVSVNDEAVGQNPTQAYHQVALMVRHKSETRKLASHLIAYFYMHACFILQGGLERAQVCAV